jgi:hypothetical protein
MSNHTSPDSTALGVLAERLEWLRACTCERCKHETWHVQDKTGCPTCDWCHDNYPLFTNAEVKQLLAAETAKARKIDGNTSDGYHTFNELYESRMLYNAAFFNAMKDDPNWGHGEHKSWRHSDGELCFGGGWFIVMATLPTGQISNHYEAKDWDLFQIEEREKADEWDGHNPRDVAKRLHEFLAIANQGIEEGRDI